MTIDLIKQVMLNAAKKRIDDSNESKRNLVQGMKYMKINIDKDDKKVGQLYPANVTIHILPTYYENFKEFEKDLQTWFAECIWDEDFYIDNFKIIPKLYDINECDVTGNPAVPLSDVTNLKEKIINHIRKAKWQILIAMYLFNNKDIYNELQKKKNEGVNIEIVLDDNEVNRKFAQAVNDLSFHYVKPVNSPNNLMHHKFFIIDMQEVLDGSYNWTNAAQFNDESCIAMFDKSNVMRYIEKFGELRNRAA